MPRIPTVAPTDWQQWATERSAVVLDVREPNEWAAGVLPGATTISLNALPGRLGELDKTVPILAVCRSGRRSGMAAAFLASRGFEVANLAGGMDAVAVAR